MRVDDEFDIVTNSELDQHFLVSPAKRRLLIAAAGIRPTDDVVEVGAGIGTVAECIPNCQNLTVIECDPNLIPYLRRRVPHAQIIQGDALTILPTIRCDVLLSNLPSRLTPAVVRLLPVLNFRVALITAPSIEDLMPLQESFTLELVVVLEPDEFRPRQERPVEVVSVRRAAK